MYEGGLQEMEGELRALQAHSWGEPPPLDEEEEEEEEGPAQVWAALGRARCLRVPAAAEEREEAEGGLARLRGHAERLRLQAWALEGVGRLLAGGERGEAAVGLLTALEVRFCCVWRALMDGGVRGWRFPSERQAGTHHDATHTNTHNKNTNDS